MSQNLTNNAIIYAILAINSEIALQQAFMEFVDIYKIRCKADKELPDIDELLNSQL